MSAPDSSENGAAWQVAPHVLTRSWDGEVVAYNDQTGHTHHFMDLAAWVLERLPSRPMTETDLVAAAECELEPPPGGDFAKPIKSSLVLFQGLGLIEPSLTA